MWLNKHINIAINRFVIILQEGWDTAISAYQFYTFNTLYIYDFLLNRQTEIPLE
uniref:Uncharacterized protein n=1 Tax=Octopus bimaculoides TaxID=37653 RepID=A0A0L8HWN2_OCTBM